MSKETQNTELNTGKALHIADVVESAADKMLMRLPVCMDWVKYKGEDVVIQWNFEATEKAKKTNG